MSCAWDSAGFLELWLYAAAAAAKSLQSCLTLCDPIDGSPPGSPVPGILQARTLEWVAVSFSNAWKWKVKVKLLSCVWLLVTPKTAAYQAPLSMGFSRQENWSGVPLPSLCGFIVFIKFGMYHQSLSFVSLISPCPLETQIKWDWYCSSLMLCLYILVSFLSISFCTVSISMHSSPLILCNV